VPGLCGRERCPEAGIATRVTVADTSDMTCIQCGSTIWECAYCETSCSAPVCERCATVAEARHERTSVVLPQLSAAASYATW
jgi:hypothetical protein